MFTSKYGGWAEVYAAAFLELDMQKLPERIVIANKAIQERLRELEMSTDHHRERLDLANAIKKLRLLERNACREERSADSERHSSFGAD